ncbi:hypothetical protein ACQCQ4_08920, partial [Ralstonia pseudosolanacearum]
MSASALRFASAWPDAAALADRLIDRHADAFGRAPHAWSVTDRADDAATAAVLLTTDAAQAERARAAGAAVVHTAFQDSTPLILFIGQVGRDCVDR